MSTGNISKKERQREQLILALLQQSGLERAASSIGISTVTAWRVSKTVEFQDEYRRARRAAFSQAIARMQQASGAAVTTLIKVMADTNAPPASRVRAADCLLERATKAIEIEDVDARVAQLERAINTGKGDPNE
jgi:predicted negative regulator of RcsB-dependent stress response